MSSTMDVAIGRRSTAPLIGFVMVTLVVGVLAVGIASVLTGAGGTATVKPAVTSEQFSGLDREALVEAGYTGRLGATTSAGLFSDALAALQEGQLLAKAAANASRYHAAVVEGRLGELAALSSAARNGSGIAAEARIGGRPGRHS